MSHVKLGVSLFSLTKEYASGELGLRDCLQACQSLGVDGYEIVGSQMVEGYPYVTDSFLRSLEGWHSEFGLRPVCYGANTDRGMLWGRDLNDEELLSTTRRDIRAAHKLGCKVMRAQLMLPPRLLLEVAGYAQDYDVRVGIEIHNPETPSTPIMLDYQEVIAKSGSKNIGFVVDLGSFADRPNYDSYQGALQRGANKAMLDELVKMRYQDIPMPEAEKLLRKKAADTQVMKSFFEMYGFLIFRKEPDLEGLKRIMPMVFHFHGKFHHMNDDGTESAIPYEKVLPVIAQSGFEGYIVSEFEGHASGGAVDAVRRHLKMERMVLGIGNYETTKGG